MKLHNFSLSSLSIKILLFYILFSRLCTFCCCFSFVFKFRGMWLAASFQLVRLSRGKWKGKSFLCQLFINAFWFCFLLKKSLFDSKCVRFDYSLQMCVEFCFTFFPVELPYHINIYECKKKNSVFLWWIERLKDIYLKFTE